MSVLDTVVAVLSQAEEPLHYKEITKRVLASGKWQTNGKTPADTINAQLTVEIKNLGQASRFRRAGKGVYALNPNGDPIKAILDPAKDTTQTLPANNATFSFNDAAEKVLEKFADRKPMHYRAITKKALEAGLLTSEGKPQRLPCMPRYRQKFSARQSEANSPGSSNMEKD